jgi:hypothetical protein
MPAIRRADLLLACMRHDLLARITTLWEAGPQGSGLVSCGRMESVKVDPEDRLTRSMASC